MRIAIFLPLIFAIFFTACEKPQNAAQTPPKKAQYTLTSLQSHTITFSKKENLLSNNHDKPYLLLFLSSWCDYCLGQAQHIANLHGEFGEALNIYGIFVDRDESLDVLKKFVADSNTQFEWFYKGDIAQLVESYDIKTFPFMLLYDKMGNLKMSYDGLTPEEMLAFDIKKVLDSTPSAQESQLLESPQIPQESQKSTQ